MKACICLVSIQNPKKAFTPELKWGPGDPDEMITYNSVSGVTNLAFEYNGNDYVKSIM